MLCTIENPACYLQQLEAQFYACYVKSWVPNSHSPCDFQQVTGPFESSFMFQNPDENTSLSLMTIYFNHVIYCKCYHFGLSISCCFWGR